MTTSTDLEAAWGTGQPSKVWQQEATLTANQFRTAIDRLELTQGGAAKLLGQAPRTVRHWVSKSAGRRIPEPVAILLRLLVAGKITIEDVNGARR